MSVERRDYKQPVALEYRGADEETGNKGTPYIVGLGAVYYDESNPDTEFWLWDDVVERILPGAFDAILARNDDVRGLFNHDANLVLGRTKSGTMRLAVDEQGLRFEIEGSDSNISRDVMTSLERGDVDGASISFIVGEENEVWRKKDGVYIREITSFDIMFDVGPVTFPAYTATSAGMRSVDRWTSNDEAAVSFRRYENERIAAKIDQRIKDFEKSLKE